MGPPAVELGDGLLAVAGEPDLEADRPEELRQQLAVVLDVVDDQDPAGPLARPEPYGQAMRSPRATSGVAGLDLLDHGQQLVQIRREDGLTHPVDQVAAASPPGSRA